MLNRLASLAMSTSVLKALPGKLDIKRHSLKYSLLISVECSGKVHNLNGGLPGSKTGGNVLSP